MSATTRPARMVATPAAGHRTKTVLTEVGPVEIDVPRDRDGSLEPKIVAKRQRRLSGVDEMVISLSAKSLTTGEVQAHLAEVYGAQVSRQTISTITDKGGRGSVRGTTPPAGAADRAGPATVRSRYARRCPDEEHLPGRAPRPHPRPPRPAQRAIGATCHDLLIAYWHVVHDQVDYADLGPDWAQRRRSTEHRTRRLVYQLE